MVLRERIRAAVQARIATDRLQAFVRRTTPNYVDGWVPRDLCRRLERFSEAVRQGKRPRMIVSFPPRHGKTMHCAERFPVWHLGRNPTHRVIEASYGLSLAKDASSEARDIALDPETALVFRELVVRKDTRAKADWKTIQGGKMVAAGIGGPITGKGADLLIIDDPIKNHIEALSPTHRESVWAWWQSTARPRMMKGGGVLVIMTRWHKDDLAGRLIEKNAHEGWEVVNYPAIAEEDEIDPVTGEVWRRQGEALIPEWFPIDELLALQESVGSKWWRSLYQGQPTDPDSVVWPRELWRKWTHHEPSDVQKMLGWKKLPDHFWRTIVSADLTFGSEKKKKSSKVSNVSLQLWGEDDESNIYLLEEENGRWKYPEQRRRLKAMIERSGASLVLVEKAADGHAAIQDLEGEFPFIEPVVPRGSKIARAEAAAPVLEQGRVYVPDPRDNPWVRDFLKEVTEFPEAANDDRVDSAGMVIRKVSNSGGGGFRIRRLQPSEQGRERARRRRAGGGRRGR